MDGGQRKGYVEKPRRVQLRIFEPRGDISEVEFFIINENKMIETMLMRHKWISFFPLYQRTRAYWTRHPHPPIH